MKPNRKFRKQAGEKSSLIYKMPLDVQRAKAIEMVGIGGTDAWNFYQKVRAEYPEYWKY